MCRTLGVWPHGSAQMINMDIREMRTQLGDTQSEFSARYGIPFRTVQNWEAGVRKPPEYVSALLEDRIREDLVNRRSCVLPKYDPKKPDLPKRSDFVGAVPWLKAVRDCLGENVVFALDEALMCQVQTTILPYLYKIILFLLYGKIKTWTN